MTIKLLFTIISYKTFKRKCIFELIIIGTTTEPSNTFILLKNGAKSKIYQAIIKIICFYKKKITTVPNELFNNFNFSLNRFTKKKYHYLFKNKIEKIRSI